MSHKKAVEAVIGTQAVVGTQAVIRTRGREAMSHKEAEGDRAHERQ